MKRKFSELIKDWPEERKDRVAAKVSELKSRWHWMNFAKRLTYHRQN